MVRSLCQINMMPGFEKQDPPFKVLPFQVAVRWPLPADKRNPSGTRRSLSGKAERMHFLAPKIEPLCAWPPPRLGGLQMVDGDNPVFWGRNNEWSKWRLVAGEQPG